MKIVVDQLAKVLHARPEEISKTRPMAELGLDSLMTLEMAMDLESAIDVTFSLDRSVGTMTIPNLVDEIIAQVSAAKDVEQEAPAMGMALEAKEVPVPTEAHGQSKPRLVA
jgi:acyl carrier protein